MPKTRLASAQKEVSEEHGRETDIIGENTSTVNNRLWAEIRTLEALLVMAPKDVRNKMLETGGKQVLVNGGRRLVGLFPAGM